MTKASELDQGYMLYERTNETMRLFYDHKFVLPVIEGWLDPIVWTRWYQTYWHYSLYISLVYLAAALIGQKIMQNRKPFQINGALYYWNLSLALFSIVGSLRCGEELFGSLSKYGFQSTICYSCNPFDVCAVWHWYFGFSKVVELGDTVFIVLKKRPLIFLHWFHHVTVLMYTWHSGSEHTAAGRWFIWINFTVHAVMYSYYAVRTHMWLPKWISMTITTGQITQMIMGVYITSRVFWLKSMGEPCQQSMFNLRFATSIYASYFLLFVKYFVDAYIWPNKKTKTQ